MIYARDGISVLVWVFRLDEAVSVQIDFLIVL